MGKDIIWTLEWDVRSLSYLWRGDEISCEVMKFNGVDTKIVVEVRKDCSIYGWGHEISRKVMKFHGYATEYVAEVRTSGSISPMK